MLQPADPQTLNTMGERIRSAVSQWQDPQKRFSLSISVGGSLSVPGQGLDGLLHDADQALYQAKEDGRNCYRQRENPPNSF